MSDKLPPEIRALIESRIPLSWQKPVTRVVEQAMQHAARECSKICERWNNSDAMYLTEATKDIEHYAASLGVEKESTQPTCPRCKGSGAIRIITNAYGSDYYEDSIECPECRGTGVASGSTLLREAFLADKANQRGVLPSDALQEGSQAGGSVIASPPTPWKPQSVI